MMCAHTTRYKPQIAYQWKTLVVILGLLLPWHLAVANTLNDVSFSSLPGDRVEIRLTMSEAAVLPNTFTIDNPARIAMDFANTGLDLETRKIPIDLGITRSLIAVKAGDRTRVVINLTKMVNYQTTVEGNHLYITIGGAASQQAQTISAPTRQFAATKITDNVKKIDFRRGEKGEGRVVIKLADPNTGVDINKRGNKLIVTLKNSHLPTQLERRLDVIDFATPVQTIDAFNQSNDVRIIISSAGKYDHLAYQTDNTFTIDIKPEVKLSEEEIRKRRKKFKYSGERLSLNFQNIEVRAVLQLIADFTGINMVTSDTVSGELTLRLKNVPWDQALDIILKSKGLDKRQNGNVMLIAPTAEIAAREKMEIESKKQIAQLAPLVTETIQINYQKALDFKNLFVGSSGGGGGGTGRGAQSGQGNSSGGGGGGQTQQSTWLSPRGYVALDPRTNKLLVVDIQEKVDAIVAMIKELDVPIRQVLIESRIVIAGTNFSKELGVRFGFNRSTTGRSSSSSPVGIGISNNVTNADSVRQGNQPAASDRLNVNLPATKTYGSIGLALARLPFGTLLDLELSASQAEGRTETVSAPRLITEDQQKAYIEQGFEIPYQTVSAEGTKVQFKEAVLKLVVTPQITPDDNIIMDLLVKKDKPDFSQGSSIPPIQKREIKTRVRVSNGATIVLGGVYETNSTHNLNKVPFFGDLPLIGVLFRHRLESSEKTELLIFITPKIIADNLVL